MSGSGAVTRNTLRQQIADALRDEVLAGRLPPGTEFTVKQIAEQYEVSATPYARHWSTSRHKGCWNRYSTGASACASTPWTTTGA